jgi:WD40 repeat protein
VSAESEVADTGGDNADTQEIEMPEPTAPPQPLKEEPPPPEPEPTVVPTEEPTPEPTPEPVLEPTPEPIPSGIIAVDNVADLHEATSLSADAILMIAAAVSPSGEEIAGFGTTSDSTIVYIWDVQTGELTQELSGHALAGMGGLEYSPDGSLLVSGGWGSDIRIWDTGSWKQIGQSATNAWNVYGLAWSEDSDRFAAVGDWSTRLTVFDAAGNEVTVLRPVDYGWLWSVVSSEDYLVTANDTSMMLYVYDADTYDLLEEVPYEGMVPFGLAFSFDGSRLASCHRDGSVNVWETNDWSVLVTIDAHGGEYPSGGCVDVDFTSGGDVIFTSGGDGWLYAWDAESGDLLWSHDYGVIVWSVDVSDDGKLVVVALDDGSMAVLTLE